MSDELDLDELERLSCLDVCHFIGLRGDDLRKLVALARSGCDFRNLVDERNRLAARAERYEKALREIINYLDPEIVEDSWVDMALGIAREALNKKE